ncbi:hypothetical protein HCN44_009105 [Aphidius gifuensis]|uniref:Serine/threonine-protein phosphatase 2A activator n=1 Tax=Aphidius gifuensis TaxID=684658 RepID=A0A834XNS9_APHGI|nr:hypothetical protein HCN44_009105 [Aphidius gifuensis]
MESPVASGSAKMSDSELEALSLDELREKLQELGKSCKGSKAVLVNRLRKTLSGSHNRERRRKTSSEGDPNDGDNSDEDDESEDGFDDRFIDDMSKLQLKDELTKRGLSRFGKRAELRERLRKAYVTQQSSSSEESASEETNHPSTQRPRNNIETIIVPVDKPISQDSNNKSKNQNNTEIIIEPVDLLTKQNLNKNDVDNGSNDIDTSTISHDLSQIKDKNQNINSILLSGIKQVQPSSSTDISSPFVQLSESDDDDDEMFIGFKESEINEAKRLLKPKRGRKMLIRTGKPGRPRRNHQFMIAKKVIKNPEDMVIWEKSEAYCEYFGFILALNEAVQKQTLNAECSQSPAILKTISMLTKFDQWITEIPPVEQPQRFGNKSFKEWLQRLQKCGDQELKQVLPEDLHQAVPELVQYLCEGFGNSTRIDYGTGHEMAFIMFLCCMFKIGAYKLDDQIAVVTKVFNQYLKLVRRLQLVYRMEPAGSHGVWSLDDYQFVPFVWGSAQLIGE